MSIFLIVGSPDIYAADDVDESMEKGIACCKGGLYDEAIAEFNKAIDAGPDNAEAYNCRGIAYLAKVTAARSANRDFKQMVSDFNSANADFSKAIRLKPDFVAAYYNRGLTNIAKYEQAIADFSRAINLKPDHARAYYYRAVEYYNLKDYKNSRSDVRKAEELGYNVDPNFIRKLENAKTAEKPAEQ
jgi:tetratricopeptide (TPR) repeat protein